MSKLRLLVTKRCNRTCPGCCNKDWDLDNLPVYKYYDDYSEIMLTGGEPLIATDKLCSVVKTLRFFTSAQIYVYTAMSSKVLDILPYVDGVTLTLHEPQDVHWFMPLQAILREMYLMHVDYVKNASLRLNIFKGVSPAYVSSVWQVRRNMQWIKDCPLPKDEVFMRLQELY